MPIFEYSCDRCGHRSEFLEKSSGKNKHVCEKCGSSDMLNRNMSYWNVRPLIERISYEDCSNVNRAYA